MKGNFADLIYFETVFSSHLPSCVKELKRAIKPDGTVIFGAPHLHMGDAKDPLDIGEYIEKVEYDLSGGPGIVNQKKVEKEISKHFFIQNHIKAGPINSIITKPKNTK